MIAIATGTRADWGLLAPVAKELRDRGVTPAVLATHAHLLPEFGETVSEIIADGFIPAARIPAYGTPAEGTAMALQGFGRWFADNRPEMVVILGDRFEMAGVAIAALLNGIPIAHIAGGTVSEGAFDDRIRNAISQMADIHFPETERSAQRLINMGIDPARIFTAGATGVWQAVRRAGNPEELRLAEEEWPMNFRRRENYLVMTLHAETAPGGIPLDIATKMLLNAIEPLISDDKTGMGLIITYPNADTDTAPTIALLKAFAEKYPEDVWLIPSLGLSRYQKAVAGSSGVIGNSSSGIVEVPSLRVPTLDIGRRQQGRERSRSVIHAELNPESLKDGLRTLLSEEARQTARTAPNPYHRTDTPELIADTLISFLSRANKNSSPG